jgi:hypothetical protein
VTAEITEFLRRQGYADHVVREGVEGLVVSWERVAVRLAQGDPAYVSRDEYLNDMDGRRIIRECLELFAKLIPAELVRRVKKSDSDFVGATVEAEQCIWGEQNERSHGYTRGKDWYYYRKPRLADPSWE